MEYTDVVRLRHSVRDFTSEQVPHDVLERIMSAATMAPSSFNAQPWHFHVTTGRSRHALGEIIAQATVHLSEYMEVLGPGRYEDAVEWYSTLGDAPVVIAVSAPADGTGLELTNKLLSVGAAIENLLLAAADEGLGACNITFAWWVRDDIAELLSLGDDRETVAIIALGYPGDLPVAAPPRRVDVVDWLD